MCGRYYVDDKTAREIERLVKEISDRARLEQMRRDVFPSDEAAVLTGGGNALTLSWQRWGFPGFQKSQVIFNARSETVLEKRMFKESVENRRVVVPCTWFYEWSREKEKTAFWRSDAPVVFMAGFCKKIGTEDHFVILTTEANASVAPVHSRMPLVLESGAVSTWIFDDGEALRMLRQPQVLLKKSTDSGCMGNDSLV